MKTPVTVYSESTPNPNTMKFVTSLMLTPNSVEFSSPDETENAPLADRLFSFPFISKVFFSKNYITLSKTDVVEWIEVTNEIREYIKNYLDAGYGAFTKKPETAPDEISKERVVHTMPQNEAEEKIISIMEEYVRPAVESDGGLILFNSYQDGVLNVELKGACSGCPSSTATLKNGIQALFNKMMPEVKEVVAING